MLVHLQGGRVGGQGTKGRNNCQGASVQGQGLGPGGGVVTTSQVSPTLHEQPRQTIG
jgi:hypothetical protein